MKRQKSLNDNQRQQGDVLISRVSEMPAGGRQVRATSRGFVVAEGEATGHAHTLPTEGVLEMREVDGVLYARIAGPVDLSHEEHNRVPLDAGIYRFDRVQEYDHFSEEARQVAD